jgi:hypothetical protein
VCRGTLEVPASKAERAEPENAELANGVDQNAARLRMAFVAEQSWAPANPEQSFVAIALARPAQSHRQQGSPP